MPEPESEMERQRGEIEMREEEKESKRENESDNKRERERYLDMLAPQFAPFIEGETLFINNEFMSKVLGLP